MRAREFLFEIRMSTANLRQLAAKTGAQAGMEFEMIVPNMKETLEPDFQRDDDADRLSLSFDNIEEFFTGGEEFNNNTSRQVRNLISELSDQYQEWKMDRIADDWKSEGLDYLRDYIENNDLFDRDEAVDQARDEFIDANPDIDADSEDAQQGIGARVDELQEQFVQETMEAEGRIYNDAFEEFSDEKNGEYDDRDFLDETYPYMSDVENNFDISWPYYVDVNEGQVNNNIDQVADEFSSFMKKPVNASERYHGGRREAGHYVVEPDGSLDADNPEDSGLEFVSPPMPIDELLKDLEKVKMWADKQGCYTNESTGLHINISVPNYSLDKLDFVKLALLIGDEYVLELFNRTGNTFARPAIGKIRDALKRSPELAPQIMDKMRGHMEELASKAIHSGMTEKYTSINTKTGYIEFRSPGEDWLGTKFDKIENTLLRFTVALSAAMDPKAYRQEYLKKLYKLLEGIKNPDDVDIIQLFSNYSAGELDKEALIRQVKKLRLLRDVEKGKVTGERWWRVEKGGVGYQSIKVLATSKNDALDQAVDIRFLDPTERTSAKAYPLENSDPQTQSNTTRTTPNNLTPRGPGPWEIYRLSDNATLRVLSNTNRADAEMEARIILGQLREQPELFGVRTRQQQMQTGGFAGWWQVMYNGEELTRVSGIGNNQSDANRFARDYVLQQIRSGQLQPIEGAEIEVIPVMD